jgi:hypothetical protein
MSAFEFANQSTVQGDYTKVSCCRVVLRFQWVFTIVVEYAMEAISHAGTVLGVLAKDGVVLAAEKKVTGKLLDLSGTKEGGYGGSGEKIFLLNSCVPLPSSSLPPSDQGERTATSLLVLLVSQQMQTPL